MRSLAPLIAAFALSAPALAQEDEARVRLEFRASASVPGRVQVDRGQEVGLAPGDRVRFLPLGGAAVEGTVESVEDRAAWVALREPEALVDLGTRGEAFVPEERLRALRGRAAGAEGRPTWTYGEDPWTDDMPLLAEVKVPKPEERPLELSGRWYSIFETTDDSEGEGRRYDFFATGVDLLWENPFARGGALHLDGELERRAFDLPDEGDESEDFARLERLSYAWGGTREAPRRFEVGRFLSHEFPQLGVIDGVEVVQRLASGDRIGGSAGFMPEPSADFDSGDDAQASVFYRHVRGEREELAAGVAFQKTWHEGHADRDLVVGDVRWYPRTGWNGSASAWVDVYGSEDEAKGSGPELTQLFASGGYRWDRAGLSLSGTILRFPELLRREFDPVTAEQLADDELRRLSLSGWRRLSDDVRLRARVDSWEDEDDSGGGGSLGVSLADLVGDRSRLDLELFANEGSFSDVTGGRVAVGLRTDAGAFEVGWELGRYEQHGFVGDSETLDQQRLRASWDVRTSAGWDLSLYAEDRFGDEQDALTLGLFLQRSF